MPLTNYIRLEIDGLQVDIDDAENFPLSISYKIEDGDNFQIKASADALGISLPATLRNDRIFNTFHNPGVEDLTIADSFKRFRACRCEIGGYDILVGKALLTEATHTNKPEGYEINAYGNNADWIIALKDSTLYDYLKYLSFDYTTANVIASWAFDGRDEQMPYVFAPVRYMLPFDNVAFDPLDTAAQKLAHYNTDPSYLRPALSAWYIIYKAFQSIGYKIKSNFFDTDYFRRMTLPWTFGAFPSSNGTKQEIHKFVAATYNPTDPLNHMGWGGSVDQYVDLNVVTPNIDANSVTGTYDNNSIANNVPDYSYLVSNQEMKWTYQTNENFGKQIVGLSIELPNSGHVTGNSDCVVDVHWFKNGSPVINLNTGLNFDNLVSADATYITLGGGQFAGDSTVFFSALVDPGDVISARVFLHMFKSTFGNADVLLRVAAFKFDYFKTPLDQSAKINFADYTFLKSYKFTDYLKGIIDDFNLSFNTDPVNKVIVIEPTHDYSTQHDQSQKRPGYINGDFVKWDKKQDLSKKSKVSLYSDGNREMIFRMKEDSSDGCFNIVKQRIQNAYQYKQDRITTLSNIWAVTKSMLGSGKYVLPDRFAKGVTEKENSFFSPCMHYQEVNWKAVTGVSPQLICIIPENISNTSASESSNSFAPKLAWYKGNVSGYGGWKFNGVSYTTIPFMFGVNYFDGGHEDPILSYCDEKIGSVIGLGLLRRFYLQRLAIIRNGQWYDTFFKLNNYDVSNLTHREHAIVGGQRWEITEIKNYKPCKEETTQCSLRKWVPISFEDYTAIYPSPNSINGFPNTSDIFETKYQPLMCLNSDIPQQ